MKKFIIIGFLAFITMSFRFQTDSSPVVNALKSGNAETISEYFDKILDIKFPDKEEIKSIGKNQAGIALKSFFDDNNIKGFELSSQREMSGTMYIAGKLVNNAQGYKVSIMLKLKDGKHQIITVRIN